MFHTHITNVSKKMRKLIVTVFLSIFVVGFFIAPIDASSSYHRGYTYYADETQVYADLGGSSYQSSGGGISLALKQTGSSELLNGYRITIRMALLALAPNNPASGPSGNGWDYPASYGGSKNICFIRFRVVGDVVGYTTTTDGTFIANNEDQSNNEGYSCYSSGQKEDLWESFEDIIELANVLITIPIPGWAAVAAFCGTVSALNAFADRSLGNDFLFWPDREASLQWSYDTQPYYLTYLAPEAAKAISYFDWTVPKTSGNYRITVYAEIGYGHLLWQQNYYRYVLIQDGTMNTYNYIRVII